MQYICGIPGQFWAAGGVWGNWASVIHRYISYIKFGMGVDIINFDETAPYPYPPPHVVQYILCEVSSTAYIHALINTRLYTGLHGGMCIYRY